MSRFGFQGGIEVTNEDNGLRQLAKLGNGFDISTVSYLTAAGIPNDNTIYFPNTAQQITGKQLWDCVDIFIKGLKSNNLWVKLYAIYLFLGGTASFHKWNAKDPRDSNLAFRLLYNGSATHNSYGIDWPNSATINANTNFNISVNASDQYDVGFSVYTGQNKKGGVLIGSFGSTASYLIIQPGRNPASNLYTTTVNNSSVAPQPELTFYNNGGLINSNRTSNNYTSIFQRGIKLQQSTTTESASAPNANVYLNNIAASQAGWNGNSRMQFAAIHKGFTDNEAIIFNTLVETLQTNLGRSYNILSPSYWFLGDSITWGQAATNHGLSWAGLVTNDKFAYEHNLGFPGYTVTSVVNNSLPLVPNKTINDKYIVISIGINDVPLANTTDFNSKLITVLDNLISKGWDSTNIVLPTIYWTPSVNAQTPPFNTVITNLWTTYGLQIHADVWQAIVDDGRGAALFHPDGVHPVDTGHAVIATYLLTLLP